MKDKLLKWVETGGKWWDDKFNSLQAETRETGRRQVVWYLQKDSNFSNSSRVAVFGHTGWNDV